MNSATLTSELLAPPREAHGVWSWVTTTNHKRIGLLYLGTITLFFFLGGIFAALIRVELLSPHGSIVSSATDMLAYARLILNRGAAPGGRGRRPRGRSSSR